MEVLSVNIGEIREVPWRGNNVRTGIFKKPVSESIRLEKTDVANDHVVDRRYHGGVDKACYVYGANHYPRWKELYPDLEWSHGMMGENLTVDQCNEDQIVIGTIYRLGGVLVQAVQPRQPCFKLGIKFGTQKVLKQFIQYRHPGVYLRVLEEGEVNRGDTFQEQETPSSGVSIQQLFSAVYEKPEEGVLELIGQNEVIPSDLRAYIMQKYDY